MCQKGYEATSMNDIADAVGLTKAGIYHYIRGKEELLFAIMGYAMDMVDADVMSPAREVADAEERLYTIIERHARRILEVGGAVTVILEEMYALTPAHRRIIRSRKRAYFELVRDTLEKLAADGKLREVNPSVATFCLFGIILWISRWYRRDNKDAQDQTLEDIIQVGMSAVLKNDSKQLPAARTALARKKAAR